MISGRACETRSARTDNSMAAAEPCERHVVE